MSDLSPEASMATLGGTTARPLLTFGNLRVLSMCDIAEAARRDYVLKGMISPGEMSVWWGAPKCGKSFLMLHIAYAIAQGRELFGRRVKPCPVLYVAAEGEAGLAGRLVAIRAEFGPTPRFHLIAQPVDLLHDGGDLEGVITAAQDPRINAGLIVLDTLSRVMAGGDENGPVDMGQFVANIGAMRQCTNAHVAVIHHDTKGRGARTPRGHTSLIGAADLVVEIARAKDGARSATVTAAKDDPDGAAMEFGLRTVNLGTDEDGDPITTCLVDEVQCTALIKSQLNKSESSALTMLRDLVQAEGTSLPSNTGFPVNMIGISVDRWRAECETRRLSMAKEKDDRTKAFKRAYDGLRDASIVETRDGLVWLNEPFREISRSIG